MLTLRLEFLKYRLTIIVSLRTTSIRFVDNWIFDWQTCNRIVILIIVLEELLISLVLVTHLLSSLIVWLLLIYQS